jgi:hypothetical protein
MTASGALLRVCISALCLVAIFSMALPVFAQGAGPQITSPTDGQYVQGQLPIKGTTDVPNFASAELDFAYASDPAPTWFTIQTASTPVNDQIISIWDTTAITDGDYLLRLRVTLTDGSTQDVMQTVKVRNYTPLPSPTPAATVTPVPVVEVPTAIIIVPTDTPTAAPLPMLPTPTALPPNPAGVTTSEIFAGFWKGALLVAVLVVLLAALMRLRR